MASNTGSPRLDIEISVSGMAKTTKDFSTLHKQLKETETEFKKANATALELESELKSLSDALSRGAISQKAFNREQKEISIALSSARQSAQQYQSRISSLNATLAQGDNIGRQYGNSVKTLQGVHDSVSKGIRGSSAVSVEFGRVLSDLPYGIQGVANNFQQLTTNLGYYTKNIKESLIAQGKQATTMNVTKALLSGLLSPMGLVTIGVSALTAGWVLYDKWQQKSKKSSEETRASLTSYIDTLNGLSKAQADGQVNAQKELVTVDQLYKATQNLNLPMKDRIKYANDLIDKGGKLFESTNAEAIVAGKASEAYDKLTNSIKNTAMAQAFMQKMTDNATKLLNNNLEVISNANDILKLNQDIARQRSLTTAGRSAGGVSESVESGNVRRLNSLYDERESKINRINELNKQNAETLKEQDILQKGINNSIEKGGSLIDGSGILPSKDKSKKSKQQTLTSDILQGLKDDQGNYYDQKLGKIREEYEKLVDSINKSKGSKADISEALGLAKTNRQFQELAVNVERFTDAVKEMKPLGAGIGGVQNASSIQLPSVLPIPVGYTRTKTPKNLVEDDFTKQFQSTLRRGLASTFGTFFDGLGDMSNKSYEIEQKYASLRASATRDQIAGLNKMEALERKINNGLTNMLTKIGSTFGAISGNMLSSALSTGIASGNFNDLKAMFTGSNKAIGYGAVGSLAGNALSGVFKPSDILGQSLSGALSGAGTGAALGTTIAPGIGTLIGAGAGALIGGLSSLFGSSKRKKEEELLRLQLEEQKKMVALQERQAALSYSSSIVGQRINEGIVASIDRNAFGELTAKVSGRDLILAIDRTKSGRG